MTQDDLELNGWGRIKTTGFTDLIGPIFAKRVGDNWSYGFISHQRHTNLLGAIHGGMLMSFIDIAFGLIAWEAADRKPCVTLQLDTHFMAPVTPNHLVTAIGTVTQKTRSTIFMRGTLCSNGEDVASAVGIWKIITKP